MFARQRRAVDKRSAGRKIEAGIDAQRRVVGAGLNARRLLTGERRAQVADDCPLGN